MRKAIWVACAVGVLASIDVAPRIKADENLDFGLFVQDALNEHSEKLFGVDRPLVESALGPFGGTDSTLAIKVAKGLKVSLVSSAAHPNADQIAFWPDDFHPTHLFVCIESNTAAPAVQRIDLSGNPASNATTILQGLTSCDPIRRTPWGSILAGEEASDGGLYEIMRPLSINTVVHVTNRATGANDDALGRVVKRQALGQLAFEGNPVQPDGTIIFGDELAPPNGTNFRGGSMYKFVPAIPYNGSGIITDPASSPLASGQIFGLKVGTGNQGQGAEIGVGTWVSIGQNPAKDVNGNIVLRNFVVNNGLTGYYRPEDMDIDPIALADGDIRVCWANTGKMSNGGGSAEEHSAIYGEVMCLNDDPDAAAPSGKIPTVRRFFSGGPQFNFFDNVAFQRHSGLLAVTEDGEVEVVKEDGTTELRGNDVLLCLPDGDDDDIQADGCVRIASLTDTTSEPTGIIFNGQGNALYLSLQHRGNGIGAIIKITGFDVRRHRRDHDDDDGNRFWSTWYGGGKEHGGGKSGKGEKGER